MMKTIYSFEFLIGSVCMLIGFSYVLVALKCLKIVDELKILFTYYIHTYDKRIKIMLELYSKFVSMHWYCMLNRGLGSFPSQGKSHCKIESDSSITTWVGSSLAIYRTADRFSRGICPFGLVLLLLFLFLSLQS